MPNTFDITSPEAWRDLETMTDTEKIDEILQILRGVADALQALGDNPMVKAMLPL